MLATIDQIRASWIADAIERYVVSLTEQGCAARNFHARMPILRRFGDFARDHGATSLAQLPAHVAPFVETWLQDRERIRAHAEGRRRFANEVRGPIEQMLRLVVPSFTGSGRPRRTQEPFATQAPAFFAYLRQERGHRLDRAVRVVSRGAWSVRGGGQSPPRGDEAARLHAVCNTSMLRPQR